MNVKVMSNEEDTKNRWKTYFQDLNVTTVEHNTVLFISPSGISELDCATDMAERSISIGRESLQTWSVSLSVDMLLSAVSVLVVAQSSSEIPEGLMNNPALSLILHTQMKQELNQNGK